MKFHREHDRVPILAAAGERGGPAHDAADKRCFIAAQMRERREVPGQLSVHPAVHQGDIGRHPQPALREEAEHAEHPVVLHHDQGGGRGDAEEFGEQRVQADGRFLPIGDVIRRATRRGRAEFGEEVGDEADPL